VFLDRSVLKRKRGKRKVVEKGVHYGERKIKNRYLEKGKKKGEGKFSLSHSETSFRWAKKAKGDVTEHHKEDQPERGYHVKG